MVQCNYGYNYTFIYRVDIPGPCMIWDDQNMEQL